jgi:hypothetical protein
VLAWEAWLRISPQPDADDTTFQALMQGLERFKRSQHWANGNVCMPSTFLNEFMWTEDPLPALVTSSIPVGPPHRPATDGRPITQADRDAEEFEARARRGQQGGGPRG